MCWCGWRFIIFYMYKQVCVCLYMHNNSYISWLCLDAEQLQSFKSQKASCRGSSAHTTEKSSSSNFRFSFLFFYLICIFIFIKHCFETKLPLHCLASMSQHPPSFISITIWNRKFIYTSFVPLQVFWSLLFKEMISGEKSHS